MRGSTDDEAGAGTIDEVGAETDVGGDDHATGDGRLAVGGRDGRCDGDTRGDDERGGHRRTVRVVREGEVSISATLEEPDHTVLAPGCHPGASR